MTLHYQSFGTGRPLVFLHGFLESSAMWKDIAPVFSEAFQYILIDLPGHGQSQSVQSFSFKMEDMAELVHECLEQEKIHKPIIIGHSMGGYVALSYLKLFSPSALILVNSTCAADTAQKREDRNQAIELVKHKKELFIHAAIPNLFWKKNQSTKAIIRQLTTEALKMDLSSITKCLEGMRDRANHCQTLIDNDIPTLIIKSKYDQVIPANSFNSTVWPVNISVKELNNSGHMSWAEEPDGLILTLKAFLEQPKE